MTVYKGKHPNRVESVSRFERIWLVRTNSGAMYSVSVLEGKLPQLGSDLEAWNIDGNPMFCWEYQSAKRSPLRPVPRLVGSEGEISRDVRLASQAIWDDLNAKARAKMEAAYPSNKAVEVPSIADDVAASVAEADNVSGARSIIEGMELKAVATIEAGQKNGAFAGAFFVATVDHVLGEGRMIQHVRTNGSEVGRWKYVSLDQSLDISRSMAFGFIAANLLGRAAGLIE